MIRIAAVAAALLATACAGTRGTSTSAASGSGPASAQPVAAKDQLICRYERPTGSNIPTRVCYTQEQLDEMSQATQDALRRATQTRAQPIK